jgi:hypothetical protein
MKKVLAVVLAAVFVCVGAYSADAQVPFATVVFDDDFGKNSKDCPGNNVLDTLTVIGANFNTFLGAIEYGISFPPSLSLIGEQFLPNKVISVGTSDVTAAPDFGLTIGFGNNPVNAFATAVIHRMIVLWNCTGCDPPTDETVLVVANGLSGLLQGAVWPTSVLFPVLGGIAVVCPTPVPVEEQTWGQIKSLYSE